MNRKTKVKTWWMVMLFMFTFQFASAYITLSDTKMEVKPGETYFLEVPDVPTGYVDYTQWACDNGYIIFQSKEDYGSYVKIDKKFTGTATVELLFVEKWYDNRGWTQQRTYLKNFILISTGGGKPDAEVEPTGITLTSRMSVYLDETKSISYSIHPKGAVTDVTWRSDDASIAKVSSSGAVTGMEVGTTKVWAETTKGGYSDYCTVTVSEPLLKKVSSSPADQENNVPYQAHISVKFNLPIFEGPAVDQITLKGENSYESVPGKLSLSGRTLNFVPDKDLEPTMTYVLTIPQNAITNKWHTGNAEEVLISFSTIPEPLIEKVSTSPSDQEKNVLPLIHPSVHFSMPIFEGAAFSQISLMEEQTNKRVAGKVALKELMLYFVPAEDLQPFTSYVLTIPQNAVKNERNKGNAAQVVVRFVTGVNPKDIKYFLVWDKQGGRVSFLLEERPRITYDLDNALVHCVTAKQDVEFSVKEVHKYTLDVVSDPQTGIEKEFAETKGNFTRQPNTLLFENFSRGTQVRVYSINGRLLHSYQVDGNGQLAISTQNWDLGVYLIHTGSATYKIIKK